MSITPQPQIRRRRQRLNPSGRTRRSLIPSGLRRVFYGEVWSRIKRASAVSAQTSPLCWISTTCQDALRRFPEWFKGLDGSHSSATANTAAGGDVEEASLKCKFKPLSRHEEAVKATIRKTKYKKQQLIHLLNKPRHQSLLTRTTATTMCWLNYYWQRLKFQRV